MRGTIRIVGIASGVRQAAVLDQIKWLGHGSFLIHGPPIIYINPWRIDSVTFHADVILIGHEHYDHFSVTDIEKLRGEGTITIGNEKVAAVLENTVVLRHWQTFALGHCGIMAIPAYHPSSVTHTREDGGLGFMISLNTYDIYYAGDTGLIAEMAHLRPDIAILPIDGNSTLTVDEAIEAVRILRPRWVLPANWGHDGQGATRTEASEFAHQAGSYARVILPSN
jgi:L-ascorbate metabolism protein UlaG (beta-lactamase superfamily)